DPLRLALLNSCETAQGAETDIFSSTAAALVRKGTPAVVAMQFEITDDAAIQFSRVFYSATAHGMPVDSAVAEARKSLALNVTNSYEWGTPVLFMRSPDGVLFRVPSAAESPEIKAAVKVHQEAVAEAAAAAELVSNLPVESPPADTVVLPRSETAAGATPPAVASPAVAPPTAPPPAATPRAAPPPAATPAVAPPASAASPAAIQQAPPPQVPPPQAPPQQSPPPTQPPAPPPAATYGWPAQSAPVYQPWSQPWVGQPQAQGDAAGRRFPTWLLVAGIVVAVLIGLGILAVLLSPPPAPSLSISPTSGRPGSAVTVFGSGFPAFEAIEVRWSNQDAFQQLQTNGAGAFITTLNVPNRADPGQRQIDARSQAANAVAVFSVIEGADPGPPETAAPPTQPPTEPPTASPVSDQAIGAALCAVQFGMTNITEDFSALNTAVVNGDPVERDRRHVEALDELTGIQNALETVSQWPPATSAADRFDAAIEAFIGPLATWVSDPSETNEQALGPVATNIDTANEALVNVHAAHPEMVLPCTTPPPT
ncbi:MAG TPA: CHAT domain-containing protein, partial [Candidatus Limnocylindrales bacterium]|nr:CHAT domain-containing protein [Candidatus Limnocylindrales bacterium]